MENKSTGKIYTAEHYTGLAIFSFVNVKGNNKHTKKKEMNNASALWKHLKFKLQKNQKMITILKSKQTLEIDGEQINFKKDSVLNVL